MAGVCDLCGKPIRRDNTVGVCSRTAECKSEQWRRWYAADPAILARRRGPNREAQLKYKYGRSVADYDALLAKQNGGCAVCGKTPEENGQALAVDHNHSCCPDKKRSCGRCVRGLLCNNCNLALGYCDDNPEVLLRLAEYVGDR